MVRVSLSVSRVAELAAPLLAAVVDLARFLLGPAALRRDLFLAVVVVVGVAGDDDDDDGSGGWEVLVVAS